MGLLRKFFLCQQNLVERSLNNCPHNIRRAPQFAGSFATTQTTAQPSIAFCSGEVFARLVFSPACDWLCAISSMPSFANCSSSGSESYALSPISFSGRSSVNRSQMVLSTRRTSWGEADSARTARGRPARPSRTAMSFVPLPRLVFTTSAPLF